MTKTKGFKKVSQQNLIGNVKEFAMGNDNDNSGQATNNKNPQRRRVRTAKHSKGFKEFKLILMKSYITFSYSNYQQLLHDTHNKRMVNKE